MARVAARALFKGGLYDRKERKFVEIAQLMALLGVSEISPPATPEVEAFLHADDQLKQAGSVFSARRWPVKIVQDIAATSPDRSSAISPMPNCSAHSPCSQTAAHAASNAGMRCARRPKTKPASTSPDPAVASHGGALALIAARPSGAAMTVSVPLRMTIAPDSSAARARTIELRAWKFAEEPLELALVRRHHDGR